MYMNVAAVNSLSCYSLSNHALDLHQLGDLTNFHVQKLTLDVPLSPSSAVDDLARQDEHTSSISAQEAIAGEEHTAQQPPYPQASSSPRFSRQRVEFNTLLSLSSQLSTTPAFSNMLTDEPVQVDKPLYALRKHASTDARLTAEDLQPLTNSEVESEHSTDSDDAYYCDVGEEDQAIGANAGVATQEESPLYFEDFQTKVLQERAIGIRLQSQDEELIGDIAQDSASFPSGARGQAAGNNTTDNEKEGSKFARFLKRSLKRHFGRRKPRKDDTDIGGTAND
ncbi:hypothetical protein ACMFMG_000594 [Clarireedia jacksonii]